MGTGGVKAIFLLNHKACVCDDLSQFRIIQWLGIVWTLKVELVVEHFGSDDDMARVRRNPMSSFFKCSFRFLRRLW